MTPIKKTYWAH